jgi:hypothetical protein
MNINITEYKSIPLALMNPSVALHSLSQGIEYYENFFLYNL